MAAIPQPNSGDKFELWKEYEAIAMHFNDLIIRLRIQSVGGVAAIATIAGIVSNRDEAIGVRWEILSGAFLILTLFWLAVWILDHGYYNKLLSGAVKAIVEIERDDTVLPRIKMSMTIEEQFNRGRGIWAQRIFYSIVFLVLSASAVFSLCQIGRQSGAYSGDGVSVELKIPSK